MKVKIENLNNSQKLLKIEVEPQKVEAALGSVYSDIGKSAKVPGYRPGKVPLDLLKQHYAKAANQEVLDRLVWESYHQAVKEHSVDPVGYPMIESVDFNEGKPLVFSVKVDVRPEFKIKNYKGISVKEAPCDVTDEDVEKSLKKIQESMAQYKNIDPRPIAMGDYVVCNFECYDDGKLVDKNDKLWLYISEQFEPKELLSALVGAELNMARDVKVTYPKDYQYKELAGRERLYKVNPREIKEKILPAINDEMAKETGHFQSLEDLRKDIRGHILEAKKHQQKAECEKQIFDNLLKSNPFDVPLSMVERQASRLVEDTKQRLQGQGYTKQDIDKEEESLKKSVSERARDNVRLYFILDRIGEEEKLAVGDAELEARIEVIAKSSNEDPVKFREALKAKNLIDNLREQMLHDKIVDFLINEAKKN